MNEEALLHLALEQPVLERPAFLEKMCGSNEALRQRLETLLPANGHANGCLAQPPLDLQATLAPLSTQANGDDVTPPPLAEDPESQLGPYKLLQRLGEGGMGVVFLAEQLQPVQRQVALKVIKPGMDARQIMGRFEAERQALALLDHPHIARVFDAGTTGSGRPYFVMELVHGVPITAYCDEQRLTLHQRLQLFILVCRAVQHAHQKGLSHRDLKPSNVLIADHDGLPTPKVIDLGVAKATTDQLTEKSLFTEFGAVAGTLEYMSPEQAELNQLDIDTRSDVYSLGVLLYELLTGTTPLERKRLRRAALLEVLRLIREEEPARPSTRLSRVDELPAVAARRGLEPRKLRGLVVGDLDWIVMKCLEKERSRRYETADGLALDLQRYLHDEPVSACPPSALYRGRKFVRRHKGAVRAAAALVLAGLLAAGGGGWARWNRAAQQSAQQTAQAAQQAELRNRLADTERAVTLSLGKVEQLREQAEAMPTTTSAEASAVRAVWDQAQEALTQAEAALNSGVAEEPLRQRVQEVHEQIEQGLHDRDERKTRALRKEKLLHGLDEARLARTALVEGHPDEASGAAKYAAAFADYGLEVKPDATDEVVRRLRAEEPSVRDALIVALDAWAAIAAQVTTPWKAEELRALARAADDDAWRQQYRQAVTSHDKAALQALSVAARQLSLPPTSLELLALSLHSQGSHAEALALLRWARGRQPTDFWMHFDLGWLLVNGERPSPTELEEALGCFRTAVALRPTASVAYNNLGVALFAKKDLDEARAAFRKAVELDPKYVQAYDSLGLSLNATGETAEALTAFRTAVTLDPQFAQAYAHLGLAWFGKKNWDKSIAAYRKAVALGLKDAQIHSNLGAALSAKNQSEDAIAEYRKATEIDPQYAPAYYNLGLLLADKKEVDEALAAYRKAIEINPQYAQAYTNLGSLLVAKTDWDAAIAASRQAIDIDPSLVQAHVNLGAALAAKREWDEASTAYRKAIELDPQDAKAHYNLGNVLTNKNQLDDAIAAYRQAIDRDASYAKAYSSLGIALIAKKDLEEGVAACRKAVELDPKDAKAYLNLGVALVVKKELDEAVTAYRKASEIDPQLAMAHYNLGNVLKTQHQLDEASAEYRKAIDLDPHYAQAYNNLGNILSAQKDLDGALDAYRKATENEPKLAKAHYNLGIAFLKTGKFTDAKASMQKVLDLISQNDALRPFAVRQLKECDRLLALEGRLPDILAGKVKPANNRERLSLAELCQLQKRPAAAFRLYRDAFTADAKLADDLKTAQRFNAACAAALAAAGQGTDADKLDAPERTRLRKQALDWLGADLDLWSKRLAAGKPEDRPLILETLQFWQRNPDLAGVRDPQALEKLPADEEAAWRKLWAEVTQLVKKVSEAK